MTAPPHTSFPRRRPRRAFTIAEVMIAASVMALAITTSITTMQRAFLALDSARNITLAGQILQGEIERLRLKKWDDIVLIQTSDRTAAEAPAIDKRIKAKVGDRFRLTRAITDINPEMKEITLTVTWRSLDTRESFGRESSRFYKTYYGKFGLHDYFSN